MGGKSMGRYSWISAPVAPEVKRQIRLAAAREDCTVSEFLRRAAITRAEHIEQLQRENAANAKEAGHGHGEKCS